MSLATRLYYSAKPFLPWWVRARMRRWHARRQLLLNQTTWPVARGSERPPRGWAGWPEGKQFAVVLTHDVEGVRGYEKIPSLLQLEGALGFRSSFNLVPEGAYVVSPEMRRRIRDAGCEVGVHDLSHDGKLYRSRERFERRARRINHYLAEWDAVGFRSAYMLHRLEWIAGLDIAYDASTFDTDPFEPQPDGVGSIFPFWLDRPQPSARFSDSNYRTGFVELPYTLAQDATMFLYLEEPDISCWRNKVDWIASHGGMVLVNVHPDYIDFQDRAGDDCFPSRHYADLLRYLQEKYAGAFWHALPHEVAAHVATTRPVHTSRRPLRIAHVTASIYEEDSRVLNDARAAADRGDHVEVLALGACGGPLQSAVIEGVRVDRLQHRLKKRTRAVPQLIAALAFGARVSWSLLRRSLSARYDVVHVHNLPDFLVFAAWPVRMFGGHVILDLHDLVPELFADKFGVPPSSALIDLLRTTERLACRMADHVIVANHLWRDKIESRSCAPGQCTALVNHVDQSMFLPVPAVPDAGDPPRRIMLFPGSLQSHQGLDIAIEALARLNGKIGDLEFHVYGDGPDRSRLQSLVTEWKLSDRVRFFDPLPLRDIAGVMARADVGVVPKRSDGFGNEAYSTKIMEFMSVGVPVIVSRTRVDQHYFNEDVVTFFEPQQPADLARALESLLTDADRRHRQIDAALAYARNQSWERTKSQYLKILDDVTTT